MCYNLENTNRNPFLPLKFLFVDKTAGQSEFLNSLSGRHNCAVNIYSIVTSIQRWEDEIASWENRYRGWEELGRIWLHYLKTEFIFVKTRFDSKRSNC